ncbi:ATP-dependent helicase [Herbiconiux sp. CPCC 203407]|uniref:DNA 3'-5' helicase n=1 Tax=Herbiconiux oxytropis TaxID=2970915 RepID=A0AA41XH28_9MICO|nr:ATP-dependent DNA helicase [Herbiconiux oxytropis]MCS5721233.1 ATP-dependent helicase [Herbiconiux oxytropis]MCS5726328.1 ATP-dependent helicase [Herbiconiux oxytropis]
MSDALFDLDDLDRPETFRPPEPAVARGVDGPDARGEVGAPGGGPGTNARNDADVRDDTDAPAPRLSAARIAELLELPPPTAQQRAVIEAPLDPRIVVAGAGSGKTETMANRVVWLIANGLVGVPEVLGLTFTRKAAGELAERIRKRLQQLADARITDLVFDPFDAPTIATYNAFANSIFRENAVVIGREGEAAVLSEASAWQLARTVVVASDDERLREMDKSVDVVASAVLGLSRALAENVVRPTEVIAYAERFGDLVGLPAGTARTKGVLADIVKAVGQVSMLPLLVDLAETYAAEKVRRGYVEYSDQIALALAIVESTPRVVEEYRDRFKVVLLDEYQDTSVVQTRLLSRLFREQAVMAVGDPHQSIYGWRGASAANLARFGSDFGADPVHGGTHPYALSTSWRNPRVVLDAANTLVQPLSATSGVPVEQLGPRPGVLEGALDVGFRETVAEEAQEVAAWFAAQLAVPDAQGRTRSAALLCRSVKKIEPFTAALDARGIPYHVLGIGGLLGQPAVADLVSMLRVLYYPTAGPDLLRVLGGARWRIGTKDLMALRTLASWIAQRDHRFQKLDAEVADRIRGSVVADEDRSVIDALDFLATANPEHGALVGFSETGLERLRRAAAEFAALRTRAGLGLIDYVDLVQQELLLDIEVLASPHAAAGRAALDAFGEQLTSFLALDPAAGLGDFLSWLEEAEKRDRLEPRSEEPEPGTVQILTIHGAKGLEWDVVAIPRMVAGELPGEPMSRLGWLSFGELPFDFRGDSAELPFFAWRGAETQGEVKAALEEFRAANSEHYAAEQRRLIYVAVTRAKSDLLLTGSFWTTGVKKPRGPGLYLRELEAAGVVTAGALPESPEHEENPLAESESWVVWPRDPLGGRRPRVEAAAEAVLAADPGARTPYDHEIDVLLAERAARGADPVLDVPVRIPASRFKDYVSDPQKVAKSLQRPMPERPFRQTRLGTRFHSWVESRYRGGESALLGLDELDAYLDELEPWDDDELEPTDDGGLAPTAQEELAAAGLAAAGLAGAEGGPDEASGRSEPQETAEASEDERLQELIDIFERSPYASRQPVEVEVEVHLVLAGRVVVCKIDAIFQEGDRFEVVDWKTGKAPTGAADLELKQLQLALYRLAYARWRGIDEEKIDASFYFVADDAVIRPERLFSAVELEQLLLGSVL